jgi:hypothetical protein
MATIDYTPPPTVKKFIKHYRPHELFFDWIIGPVGSGKTTGIFFKLVYMASLQAKSPIDGIRRSRAVVVRNTGPQLSDTTLVSWNYWFKNGQAGEWKATPKTFVLRFGDVECEVLFRALDTEDDVSKVLSLEVTFAILDEFVEINQKIIEGLSARCGRYPPTKDGGATNWGMWGSSNPGNEDVWWYDYLYERRPGNVTLYEQPSGLSPDAENVENLPGGVGYYTSLMDGKSEHWISQYIKVLWGFSLAGTPVVTTYNSSLHVAQNPLKANPLLPLVIGMDPGLIGSALLIGQMDLFGRLTVLDELIQRDYGATRIINDRLKPLLRAKYRDFEVILAPDPAAAQRTQTDEQSVVDVFRKAKFRVEFPDFNNRLAPRLEAIEYFTTRITGNGPALLIAPHVRGLQRALQGGWRYKIIKDVQQRDAPEKNSHSHVGDGFSYLCRYFQHNVARDARRRNVVTPPPARNIYVNR